MISKLKNWEKNLNDSYIGTLTRYQQLFSNLNNNTKLLSTFECIF